MTQEEKKLPEGLEEAAGEYNKQVIEETKCHHNALTYAEGYEDALLLIPDAFIAGAEWQKAKMMEEAVEGMVCATITGTNAISFLSPLPDELNAGDKVRVIIIKEDEK